LRPKIPKDLETICLVCLQKNPAHRYGSAAALAEDLRRFLENEPILARRTHLPERVVKWATRRPLFATLALAGLTMTSVFWWVSWNRAVRIEAEKGEMFVNWQKSEAQLLQAMQTIDQIVESEVRAPEGQPPVVLLKARSFYQRLLEQDGPANRVALANYRLAIIHERMGDRREAIKCHQEAINRWEGRPAWANRADFESQLLDSRERLLALRAMESNK
jgi:tetratricopeptide (TPR) repeat protein